MTSINSENMENSTGNYGVQEVKHEANKTVDRSFAKGVDRQRMKFPDV